MQPPKVGIFDVAGHALTDEEKCFYAGLNPLGFILFARNCESPAQVKALVTSLKDLLGRDDVLILIDQEGGRVARLKPPHWRKAPPAGQLAEIAGQSIAEGKKLVYANARLIARDLNALGINVNCVPLADVPAPGSHDIIGDRAFGDNPQQVSILAEAMARGMMDGGVLPVLKHIPGHGRAMADSHLSLPVVDASLAELRAADFVPFKALRHLPLGMTAHVLYTAIDKELPATLSAKVITLIREEIGFDGLLMSDDLSMKALKGDLTDLTRETLEAGCDIALYCNIPLADVKPAAAILPPLSDAAEGRFLRALARLKDPTDYDYADAEQAVRKAAGEWAMTHTDLAEITTYALPLIFAITFHEASHAFAANRFGDPTARLAGRMSFDPIKHIDPYGTILLPGILLLAHAPTFGYAKPVPVNFGRLKPQRLGMIVVALAGPAMNLLLAFLSALLLHLDNYITPERSPWTFQTIYISITVNCLLAAFNMLPILPLDGGRVLNGLLPPALAREHAKTERFGMVFVLLLVVLPGLLPHSPIANLPEYLIIGPMDALRDVVLHLAGIGNSKG